VNIVQIPGWERYPWLRHGFSTRLGGVSTVYGVEGGQSLNLGWTRQDDPILVAENRRRFAHAVAGEAATPAITLRQIHSTLTHRVAPGSGPFVTEDGRALVEGDGLLTALPGVLLGIQTADCVPVMLIDPARRAVAIFHAGWRGTVAGIVEKGVSRMLKEFGSHPGDLLAAVGPSIGPCCYIVGEEVRTAFTEKFPYGAQLFQNAQSFPQGQLNLWEANRRQLLDAGIPAAHITVVAECTGCARNTAGQRKYFSHRIDQGVTGRMMSIAGIAATPSVA
jgi:YfiH family protein